MFARPHKRGGAICGNNADIRLAKAGHQQLFAPGHRVKQICVPAQGPQRDSFHIVEYAKQVMFWKGGNSTLESSNPNPASATSNPMITMWIRLARPPSRQHESKRWKRDHNANQKREDY
jgi:hypothetical protein